MKLAVVTPWASPFMYTKYVDAMLNLERPPVARNDIGDTCTLATGFFRGEGWCPARRHMDGCEKAVEWGADLICIVGADQAHPPDMLCRLIDRWNEGYEVVSAMIPTRGYIQHMSMKPFQPMAWRVPANEDGDLKIRKVEAIDDLIEKIDPEDGDIQRINFIGSGVLMFHKDHLLALERPWFFETVDRETCSRLACMDTKFVWRLQMEAGAQVWCDTTIKVKHIHDMEIDDTFQDRFDDWMDGGGEAAICETREPVEV
jgi:hypothetical protein